MSTRPVVPSDDFVRVSLSTLCAESGSTSRGINVLNDLMLSSGKHESRQQLSLSDINWLLSEASRRNDIGFAHMVVLALKLKKSMSCGHSIVEYMGQGRNPASIALRDCLLVRFGCRVYSYRPAQNITPIDRWDGRLSLLLSAPGGVAAFNKLVFDKVLLCVGPSWDLTEDDLAPSPTRDVVFSAFSADDEILLGTTLIYAKEEGHGAPPYSALSLVSAGGLVLTRLEGDALLYMIARGFISVTSEQQAHDTMLKLVAKSSIS